jgi:putative tryptophan/tyrosine transport system substrate-binding protein
VVKDKVDRVMLLARQFLNLLAAGATVSGRIRLVLIAALLSLGFPAAARAGEVVIVLSGDNLPYVQAETGLKKQFATEKRETRSVALRDVSAKGLDATVGDKADLVVAVGTAAAVWLHAQLPAATPLVYCMVADPATFRLTEGRTTYGVSTDVAAKPQLGLIAEALPKARTLGILYRSNTLQGQRQIKNLEETLPKDWQLKPVALDKYDSVADAVDALMKQQVDVVWTTADSTVYDTASVRALLLASLRTNTPVFGYSAAFVKAGALFGISVDPEAQGKQAATLALTLLKGAGDTKLQLVNAPESFQIAVNLIVASQIGLQLPADIVQRATFTFKEGR